MGECSCKFEREIERIILLLDGNGKEGIVRDIVEIRKEQKNMCTNMVELREISNAQAKSISGFSKYISTQEVLDSYRAEKRKEKRQIIRFMIAQSLVVIGLIVTIIIAIT